MPSQTTYTLQGNQLGWVDTLHNHPDNEVLHFAITGQVRFTGSSYTQVEGAHKPSYASGGAFALNDRATWQDYPTSLGNFPAINVPVPLSIVVAVKAASGSAPSNGWTLALLPFQEQEQDIIGRTQALANVAGRSRTFTQEELYRAAGNRSGPYDVYVAINYYAAGNGADSFALTINSFHDGLGGFFGDASRPWTFGWDKATDAEDRRRGGYCAETGIWAPDHSLVETSQGRMIDYFAPDEF